MAASAPGRLLYGLPAAIQKPSHADSFASGFSGAMASVPTQSTSTGMPSDAAACSTAGALVAWERYSGLKSPTIAMRTDADKVCPPRSAESFDTGLVECARWAATCGSGNGFG